MAPIAPYDKLTVSFQQMYSEVTVDLVSHVVSKGVPVNSPVHDWFNALVTGFAKEYSLWGKDATTAAYLRQCHRKAPKLFHLMADAYLHIAYDLPRVIADSDSYLYRHGMKLHEKQESYCNSALLFQSMGPVFLDCFRKHGTTLRIGGFYGLMSRMFPAGWINVTVSWVLALRNAAWIHAGILMHSGAKRAVIEESIRATLLNAAKQATPMARSFLIWWPAPPILAPALLLFAQVPAVPAMFSVEVLWILVAVVVALVAARIWLRFRELRRFSDRLGRQIFEQLNRLMIEESRLMNPEDRRQFEPPMSS